MSTKLEILKLLKPLISPTHYDQINNEETTYEQLKILYDKEKKEYEEIFNLELQQSIDNVYNYTGIRLNPIKEDTNVKFILNLSEIQRIVSPISKTHEQLENLQQKLNDALTNMNTLIRENSELKYKLNATN
jgi:hypothetical protein